MVLASNPISCANYSLEFVILGTRRGYISRGHYLEDRFVVVVILQTFDAKLLQARPWCDRWDVRPGQNDEQLAF